MIIRTSSQCPLVLVLRLFDWQTVDASQPQAHQPVLIELPILIAIRAKRIPGVVVPFIGTAHRDMIPLERPELFDQPIVQLFCPIAPEKATIPCCNSCGTGESLISGNGRHSGSTSPTIDEMRCSLA